MSNSTLIKKLVADGFSAEFAKKAVVFIGVNYSAEFRSMLVNPVQFVRDNEYIIRNW